ncbi:hypothetical protein C7S18_17435 [Ahniella affigens]|uniref:Uncharacterized protein n=1 Tax=Ahniella affigens TaxID=2021234 RepID=A0A2P1PVH6_9GAMM|nr:hypothetical protein C7S18_17435 [Ahniella affigens]
MLLHDGSIQSWSRKDSQANARLIAVRRLRPDKTAIMSNARRLGKGFVAMAPELSGVRKRIQRGFRQFGAAAER